MIEIRKTDIFVKWLASLKDRRAKARVLARIDRLEMGYFGDVRPVDEGVSELRIFLWSRLSSLFYSTPIGVGYSFIGWRQANTANGYC